MGKFYVNEFGGADFFQERSAGQLALRITTEKLLDENRSRQERIFNIPRIRCEGKEYQYYNSKRGMRAFCSMLKNSSSISEELHSEILEDLAAAEKLDAEA